MTRRRGTAAVLTVAFAAVVGHVAWQSWIGPAPAPEHFITADGAAFAAPDTSAKNLYLRRLMPITQRPRHAWLQVVARDRVRVYVNGVLVAGEDRDGLPLAILVDLTPHLALGANVLAVTARQASHGYPPVVSVTGEYTASDGQVLRIEPDSEWRAATRFEHGWLADDFHDRQWDRPRVVSASMRAAVNVPPDAIRSRGAATWITPPAADAVRTTLLREFVVADRPEQAWMRLATTSGYRLWLNDVLVDEREEYVGTEEHSGPVRRSYDITTLVRRGANVVTVSLTRTDVTPHLLADLQVDDASGGHVRIATDEQWLARSNDTQTWESSRVEPTDVGYPPWSIPVDHVAYTLPWPLRLQRVAAQGVLVLLVALATWFACRLVARRLGGTAWVALLLPTIALGTVILATYDPRIFAQELFQPVWPALAVAAVPAQWLLLLLGKAAWHRFGRRGTWHLFGPTARPVVRQGVAVAALMIAGAWLRIGGLTAEPLQWDEVEHYEYTIGFLERGFPSRTIHPDLPVAYVHTSEMMFVPSAIAAAVFENPRLVMRVPAFGFSVLTILVVFLAGRRMFAPAAGLIAAALVAFSPVVVSMSTVGRYFAQLQFFTLLVIYALWLTVRGRGRINRKALAVTGVGFVAMYLTWEGAAFLAIGLALAALLQRRRQLRTIFFEPAVWLALVLVGMAVVLQYSHVVLEQTKFLWYGTSLSDLRVRPMWEYPTFAPWFYIWASSWSLDSLLPMLVLVGGVLLSARHAFRDPLRFLLVIHLTTCLFMATLLPAMTWRYIHHLIPVLALVGSAVLIAAVRPLLELGRHAVAPAYARAVVALVVVGVVVVASGVVFDLRDMSRFRVDGFDTTRYKFPDVEGAAHYVRERLQPGDVVLATDPFQVKHFMGLSGQPADPVFLWPASTLQLSATLDDRRPLPLDRRDGTPAIVNRASLQSVFDRYERIWYVVQPERHENQNVPEVSTFLRQHMNVEYEDFEAVVLLRDRHHRRAIDRYLDEKDLGFGNRHRINFPAEPRLP